jgi:hypothetical protein
LRASRCCQLKRQCARCAVIRLKSWPFSAMISANDWLERRIETIFDECFCLIMCPCHLSSSVLTLFAVTQYVDFASYAGLCSHVSCEARSFWGGVIFCQVTWPLMLTDRRKRRFQTLLWPKLLSGHIMRQTRSAEAAWQRGTFLGKQHFLSDK